MNDLKDYSTIFTNLSQIVYYNRPFTFSKRVQNQSKNLKEKGYEECNKVKESSRQAI